MEENAIADIRSVLADHGLPCRNITRLSPAASGRKIGRSTFRVELVNGSSVKVRRFESAEEAARLADIRGRLNPSFAPVMTRCGAMLVEAWIEGEELTSVEAAARAEDVGALLGQLHATELPVEPSRVTTRERSERADEQLDRLEESGLISAGTCKGLQLELLRTDPGETVQTMVHLDYCPENLVVDSTAGLHVIDNEWIRIGPPGQARGRTISRWPMSDEVWQRFLRGYFTTAPVDPGPLSFWMIVMAAAGAIIRLQKSFVETFRSPGALA